MKCNLVEDEYHLLFECTSHDKLRKEILMPVLNCKPSVLEFHNLLASSNETIINAIVVFIKLSLKTEQLSVSM